MMRLRQIWAWTRFTLSEYVRSGRIMIELVATIAFIWLFLRKPSNAVSANPFNADHFFNLVAIFTLLTTVYTSTVIAGLGQRAQGYVVLARSLGRRGYLYGLFFVPVIINTLIFLALSVIVTLINRPMPGWNLLIWGAGALPLVLDIALVAAIVLLLSGLVLSPGWRLVVLGIVALALLGNTNFFDQKTGTTPPGGFGRILEAMQTLLGIPLTPIMAGFELSARRLYSAQSAAVILGQVALLVAVLAFAVFAFERRDVILS